MRRRLMRGRNNRGFILITGYLLLSALLIYTNIVTMNAVHQRAASDQLRERFQAVDMCQGSLEQLSDDLGYFLQVFVYQLGGMGMWAQGDAPQALAWLDKLGDQREVPVFDIPYQDTNNDRIITTADADGVRDASPGNKLNLTMTVPSATVKPVEYARAWIVAVQSTAPGDPLAPRNVIMEAEAKVGNTVKHVRATYTVRLGMSDIFRYAYFINNFGWFSTGGSAEVMVNGEVRANGDFKFSGNTNNIYVNGDIYASQNPDVINPLTGDPSTGTITGNPREDRVWGPSYDDNEYFKYKPAGARPPSPLSSPFEPPAIGGSLKYLPDGYGWDGQQNPFPAQAPQPMPYLGDLGVYKQVAQSQGSTLSYFAAGPDKQFNTNDDVYTTIKGIYHGPDGVAGTADDNDPLVLVGPSKWRPIRVNGPVVIPGDVIIKGDITGRGTVYSGRNVHVAGDLNYQKSPMYLSIIRDRASGQLKDWTGLTSKATDGQYQYNNIGSVCSNGTYLAPGGGGCK